MMKKDEKLHSLGVVITGGSSGLGYALSAVFLAAGDRVVICGRDQQRLDKALSSLNESCGVGRKVYGMVCDVGNPSGAEALAVFASVKLGRVDRWINNAGTAGQFKRPLWELHADDILQATEQPPLPPGWNLPRLTKLLSLLLIYLYANQPLL